MRLLSRHSSPFLPVLRLWAALFAVVGLLGWIEACWGYEPPAGEQPSASVARLRAARQGLRAGDKTAVPVLAKLLVDDSFDVRFEAHLLLTSLTSERFGYSAGDRAEKRQAAAVRWVKWARQADLVDVAGLRLPTLTPVQLLNGRDLAGWQAVDAGKKTKPGPTWTFADGIVRCSGDAAGYLRTEREFEDYLLSLEWRWPAGEGGDSGIFILLDGPDAAFPNGLEAQLYAGRAGDFWVLGGFEAKVDGKSLPFHARKRTDSNEKEIGQWNRMEIVVYRGDVSVLVNGTLQNAATVQRKSGKVGLQVEGDAIEFRNLQLHTITQGERLTGRALPR